jgi:glycine C-acetyltransferase
MIATDGVFSMDGDVAPLPQICDLAEKYKAMVMVDDSHATGFVGKKGRGSHEFHNCMGRVDIITSTLGKALGGATGDLPARKRRLCSCCGIARGPICSAIRCRRRSWRRVWPWWI